jgi:hypothetical protein
LDSERISKPIIGEMRLVTTCVKSRKKVLTDLSRCVPGRGENSYSRSLQVEFQHCATALWWLEHFKAPDPRPETGKHKVPWLHLALREETSADLLGTSLGSGLIMAPAHLGRMHCQQLCGRKKQTVMRMTEFQVFQ